MNISRKLEVKVLLFTGRGHLRRAGTARQRIHVFLIAFLKFLPFQTCMEMRGPKELLMQIFLNKEPENQKAVGGFRKYLAGKCCVHSELPPHDPGKINLCGGKNKRVAA